MVGGNVTKTRSHTLARSPFLARLAVAWYLSTQTQRMPCRTSILSGEGWTPEILEGHATRFLEVARMEKQVFHMLLIELDFSASKYVSKQQSLLLFLFIIGHHNSSRSAQERFQMGGATVHTHFHRVLAAVVALAASYIKLPPSDTVPGEIRQNPKFWPLFKDCIGAIDGTHIPVSVAQGCAAPYRNRKGWLSHNVLAACGFDLRFQYVLAG